MQYVLYKTKFRKFRKKVTECRMVCDVRWGRKISESFKEYEKLPWNKLNY